MSRNCQTPEELDLARRIGLVKTDLLTLEPNRRASLYRALDQHNRSQSILRIVLPFVAALALVLTLFWSIRLVPEESASRTNDWKSSGDWVAGNDFAESRDALTAKLSSGNPQESVLRWQGSSSPFQNIRQRTDILAQQIQSN